ncbi:MULTISPECIES: type II toxin-antitoxin system RelE/ParE family toxin [unclassified Lentimonas]|uniref:type II toxin-antitoxin system RelE/ParE family toxin n=1 Tax=unclassified Lentimonas TaxID=2630993 RepID=UPI00132240A1|nr:MULTISPECIES: type II toxin-antitoxin system RelE/ParE family toxin [unclassified Lentimonas]CAA6685473.1 Unannotated [Lentimonas sp. CC6]CAA6695384.1 Unannotated [Lentimonas sp. CC19]CAA7068799.1 Unannotated [Lentimonas sp. CC11]CAA7170472.1 Unannotated [Lentimonas sp. CC21]CAA6678381.1 Unannotated [Lentimonas sp. CC4]
MVYQVILSNRSIDDLKGICEYIAAENAEAAQKLGHALLNQIQALNELPRRGRIYDASDSVTIYEIPMKGYRAFYQINESAKQIQVLHIRHAARSEPKL